MDLVALVPAARGRRCWSRSGGPARPGRARHGRCVAALGWPRVNFGIEARPVVGVSLSDGFPLLLSDEEASLIGDLPGARRVFERQLVVAAGGGFAGEGNGVSAAARPPAKSDTLSRFRAYNVIHADLLNEILDVAPLTRARLEGILAKTARLVSDFDALFGGSSDRATRVEAEALVRLHADLRSRTLEALGRARQAVADGSAAWCPQFKTRRAGDIGRSTAEALSTQGSNWRSPHRDRPEDGEDHDRGGGSTGRLK
jgi:hypothetical protein